VIRARAEVARTDGRRLVNFQLTGEGVSERRPRRGTGRITTDDDDDDRRVG